jgi:ubiquinone/menaquinone biosynthesis C-methylase UbiE
MTTSVYQHQDQLLAATSDAEARHFWFRGFRRFVTPLVERAVAGLVAPRALDCGCGTGANVALLGRYGEAFGFDYTLSGLRTGTAAGLRKLVQASAAAIPYPAATFDLVTSFDMLQVLPDGIESAALSEMARVLKPGGALVLNVAAMRILHGHHALLSEEARRYSRSELRTKLQAAGFLVERMTHTNASLFPVMLAVRAVQRLQGAEAKVADIAVPPAPINALFGGLLAMEAKVVRRLSLPFGSSIVCLARKAT